MDVMFWVWLGVIVVSAIIEFATMEIVSIWFTFGAIVPFIMAATNSVRWEIQLVVFVIISALLIVTLRSLTKKFLLKNTGAKTNADSMLGKHYRMLEKTDFETMGSVKVNDVVWSAIEQNQQTIEKGEIVEVVKISGNKLVVKKIEQQNQTDKPEVSKEKETIKKSTTNAKKKSEKEKKK